MHRSTQYGGKILQRVILSQYEAIDVPNLLRTSLAGRSQWTRLRKISFAKAVGLEISSRRSQLQIQTTNFWSFI